MVEYINNVFTYLSTRVYLAAFIFTIVGIGFCVILKKIANKINFLQDHEKFIPFQILISSMLLLLLGLILKKFFKIPSIWFLVYGCLAITGFLGLIPFSFFKDESNFDDKSIQWNKSIIKSMGIWSLLMAIVGFLVGFFIIYRTSSEEFAIGIIFGLVSALPGILIGIFFGMIFGYFWNEFKNKK